jgi:hypothetical protein
MEQLSRAMRSICHVIWPLAELRTESFSTKQECQLLAHDFSYTYRMISVFRRDIDEICPLMGYYAASYVSCVPTFRENVSDSWPLKMGPLRCPETSVNKYHTMPRNIPEVRRSHGYSGSQCSVYYSSSTMWDVYCFCPSNAVMLVVCPLFRMYVWMYVCVISVLGLRAPIIYP